MFSEPTFGGVVTMPESDGVLTDESGEGPAMPLLAGGLIGDPDSGGSLDWAVAKALKPISNAANGAHEIFIIAPFQKSA